MSGEKGGKPSKKGEYVIKTIETAKNLAIDGSVDYTYILLSAILGPLGLSFTIPFLALKNIDLYRMKRRAVGPKIKTGKFFKSYEAGEVDGIYVMQEGQVDYSSQANNTQLLPASTSNATPGRMENEKVAGWTYKEGLPWDGMEKGHWWSKPKEQTIPIITIECDDVGQLLNSNGEFKWGVLDAVQKKEAELRKNYNDEPVYIGIVKGTDGKKRAAKVPSSSKFYEGPILYRIALSKYKGYKSPESWDSMDLNQREVSEIDYGGEAPHGSKAKEGFEFESTIHYSAVILNKNIKNPKESEKKMDEELKRRMPDKNLREEEIRKKIYQIGNRNPDGTYNIKNYRQRSNDELTGKFRKGFQEFNNRYPLGAVEKLEKGLNFAYKIAVGGDVVMGAYAFSKLVFGPLLGIPADAYSVPFFLQDLTIVGLIGLGALEARQYRNMCRKVKEQYEDYKIKGMGSNIYCIWDMK